MAATGKTPILLYGSTTATNQPSAGNLTNSSDGCEIAINVADKNLFFKDATNTVNTVPIRQSSASSDGWLSSTDWSTFNSKQPAGSYLTSVTVDAPLTGAGTSGSHLSIPAASGSTNGYLSSADWTTFNNKAPTTSPSFSNSINVLSPSTTSTTVATFSATTNGTGGITYVQIGTEYADGSSRIGSVNVTGNISKLIFQTMRTASGSFTEDFSCSSGNVTIPDGNLVIGTSGKGIDFSATAGTGTSELLADYEEGTWTPTFTGSGGDPTLTYAARTGKYTKIGNVVYWNAFIAGSATGGGGNIGLSGLPYTVSEPGVTYCNFVFNFTANAPTNGLPNAGATTVTLFSNLVASDNTQALVSSITSGATAYFRISGFYYV